MVGQYTLYYYNIIGPHKISADFTCCLFFWNSEQNFTGELEKNTYNIATNNFWYAFLIVHLVLIFCLNYACCHLWPLLRKLVFLCDTLQGDLYSTLKQSKLWLNKVCSSKWDYCTFISVLLPGPFHLFPHHRGQRTQDVCTHREHL